jgi:membrane-bound lytic murein transglycosylase D
VLPAETKNYVPGIIAAIIMAKNPEQYGLDRMVPEAAVISDTVTVDYPIDLRLVADVTGASLQEIVALNPSLLRMTTPRDMMFDLHLPEGTKDAYTDRIKGIPEDKRTSWRFHVVRSGESLEGIATALHTRPSEIATVNDLSAGQNVAAGDELIIPVATAAGAVRTQHYTVRKGDTLVTVADQFNVSVAELRSWNHLPSSTMKTGQVLNVEAPVRLAPLTHTRAKKPRSGTGSATTKAATSKTAPTVKSSATKTGSAGTGNRITKTAPTSSSK